MEFNAFSEHACINCAHHKNDQKTAPFHGKSKETPEESWFVISPTCLYNCEPLPKRWVRVDPTQ
jgi:hypothetical protein